MKNQKYKKNKNTKKSKNGFRRRSRKHIKGGMRSDWIESNRVKDKDGKTTYIVYDSVLHPRIHITYRGEDNFHATTRSDDNFNNKFHFGHNIEKKEVGFWATFRNSTIPEPVKTNLALAWKSFNNGTLARHVIREDLKGNVVVSRQPISSQGATVAYPASRLVVNNTFL